MRALSAALLFLAVHASATEVVTPRRGRTSTGGNGNPTGVQTGGAGPTLTPTLSPTGSGVFSPTVRPTVQVNPQVNAAAISVTNNPAAQLNKNQGAPVAPIMKAETMAPVLTNPAVEAAPGVAPGAQLEQIGTELEKGRKAESEGSEGAMGASLDKVFDDMAHSAGVSLNAPAGVAGKVGGALQTIKQHISVANNVHPRDAVGLYVKAAELADKELPPALAAEVKAVALRSAAGKARLSLATVANDAYQAAAASDEKKLDKELEALDKWDAFLSKPGAPLISNKARLVADVRRVAAQRPDAAPVIHFRPLPAGGYYAVLPLSSVAPVPPKLIASVNVEEQPELAGPDAAVETALSELRRGEGASALYRAHKKMGASVPSAALSTAGFWLRNLAYSLWDMVLELIGRGPSALARGAVSLKAGAPVDLTAYKLYGRLAEAEASLAWRLSEPEPSLRLVEEAKAAAELHQKITGSKTGLLAVQSLARRLERRRELSETDALALAHWLGRLRDDALRFTVRSSPTLGVTQKIGGKWDAAVGEKGAGLAAAEKLLADVPGIAQFSLVVDGPRLWLSKPGFKAFLDARGTHEGGRVALAFEGPGEPQRLRVERRGKLTLAWLDGEQAAAGASELVDVLASALAGNASPEAGQDGSLPLAALAAPEAVQVAAAVRVNDYAPLSWSLIGEYKGQPVLRSKRGKLSITVLRDPLTGEPSRAFAESGGKPVSAVALGGMLRLQ